MRLTFTVVELPLQRKVQCSLIRNVLWKVIEQRNSRLLVIATTGGPCGRVKGLVLHNIAIWHGDLNFIN